jgi:hypothetical protein
MIRITERDVLGIGFVVSWFLLQLKSFGDLCGIVNAMKCFCDMVLVLKCAEFSKTIEGQVFWQ